MTTLREAAQQALEALESAVEYDYHGTPLTETHAGFNDAANALRAALAEPEGGGNLPPPLQEPEEFDHSIGADRFKVVRGAFWWHVLIGDSPTEHGKFRSRASAEKMAADLLREFRNGAFVQHEASLAEPVQEPVAWKDKTYESLYHQDFGNSIPLYTAPPQRKPLTEEEIEKAYREIWSDLPSDFDHTSAGWIEMGIKYAERAHGIT